MGNKQKILSILLTLSLLLQLTNVPVIRAVITTESGVHGKLESIEDEGDASPREVDEVKKIAAVKTDADATIDDIEEDTIFGEVTVPEMDSTDLNIVSDEYEDLSDNEEIILSNYFADNNFAQALQDFYDEEYPGVPITKKIIRETQELNLENKNIEYIKGIERFEQLRILNLNNNTGLNHLSSDVLDLPMLESLSIIGCSIYKIDSNMSKLKNLYIGGLFLGDLPQGISRLNQLEHLEIKDSSIRKIPAYIHQMGRLKTLVLDNNYLTEIEDINFVPENLNIQIRNMEIELPIIKSNFKELHESIETWRLFVPSYVNDCLWYNWLEQAYMEVTDPHWQVHTYTAPYWNEQDCFKSPGEYQVSVGINYLEQKNIVFENLKFHNILYLDEIRGDLNPEQMFPNWDFYKIVENAIISRIGYLDWTYLDKVEYLDIANYNTNDYRGIQYLTGLIELTMKSEIIGAHIDEIVQLTNLNKLTLIGDKLDALPQKLGTMTNLQTLEIDIRWDAPAIPDTISSLVNLKKLRISTPYNTDIPSGLWELNNLEELHIDFGNDVAISPQIGQLTSLKKLDAYGYYIESLPDELFSLEALTEMRIVFNKVTRLPSAIGNLRSLQSLSITGDLLESIPPEIGNLQTLLSLYLSCKGLVNLPAEIGNLSSLKGFDAYVDNITSLPSEIQGLTSLMRFHLSNAKMEALPPEIGNLSNLSDLGLYCGKITSIPPEIGNLSNLESFNIFNCFDLTTLPAEIQNLSKLSRLKIGRSGITSLPDAIGAIPKLRHFDLERLPLTHLPAGIGNCPNLTYFSIYEVPLVELPQEIGNLKKLDYFSLSNTKIKYMPDTIVNIPTLKSLYTYDTPLEALPMIQKANGEFLRLRIRYSNITEEIPDIYFNFGENEIEDLYRKMPEKTKALTQEISWEEMMTPFMKQLKRMNNDKLTGRWQLTQPNKKTITIPAGDGSEISSDLFTQIGNYTLYYNSDGNFVRPAYKFGSLSVHGVRYVQPINIVETLVNENALDYIFPDPALAQFVAEQLGKEVTDEVLPEELASISKLQAAEKGIAALDGIGRLTGLTHLYLGKNQITNLPDELWTLTNLKLLDLQSNQITELNEGIGNLAALTTLQVNKNKIPAIPQQISNLSQLKVLYAQDNVLTKRIPDMCFTIRTGNYTKQNAELPAQSIVDYTAITYEQFLPEFVMQLKEKNGGTLIGEWVIKKPDNSTLRIPAGDGSEVNSGIFSQSGQYNVRYHVSSGSYAVGNGNVGTLSYTSNVTIY